MNNEEANKVFTEEFMKLDQAKRREILSSKRAAPEKIKNPKASPGAPSKSSPKSKKKDKDSDSKRFLPSKIANKPLIRAGPRANVVIAPAVTVDRSRFFDSNYELERRQLFFS